MRASREKTGKIARFTSYFIAKRLVNTIVCSKNPVRAEQYGNRALIRA